MDMVTCTGVTHITHRSLLVFVRRTGHSVGVHATHVQLYFKWSFELIFV